MKKFRVLHLVGHLGVGGDSVAILNVLDYIKKNNINVEFEFATHVEGKDKPIILDTISKMDENGIRVNSIDGDVRRKGIFKYYKEIKKILINNEYDAIHVHTSFQGIVAMIAAKICKVEKIIAHSHTTKVQRKTNKLVLCIGVPIVRFLIRIFATDFVACGEEAGNYLFGHDDNNKIIYNGINNDKFTNENFEISSKLKKLYSIEDNCIVIGHVGRFCDMKNQRFILDLAEKTKYHTDIRYILIGDGEKYKELKEIVNEKNLNNIIFTGRVNDVNNYMKVFDYFILPSLYGEGLPMVLVEAQTSGCYCIASDNITKEANIGLLKYLDIKNIDDWKKNILTKPNKKDISIDLNKFDINKTALKWISLYNIE